MEAGTSADPGAVAEERDVCCAGTALIVNKCQTIAPWPTPRWGRANPRDVHDYDGGPRRSPPGAGASIASDLCLRQYRH